MRSIETELKKIFSVVEVGVCKANVWTQKKGKLTTSHRYNPIPLLRSRPGGVFGELVV